MIKAEQQKNLLNAGVELCQAQVKLEVAVEIGAEVETCHCWPRWVGGGWTKTKVEVEFGVALGKTSVVTQPNLLIFFTKSAPKSEQNC